MLVPKVVDRGGDPWTGCACQDWDCCILQLLLNSHIRWGLGFQPADLAYAPAVSHQSATSVMETIKFRLSFFYFRTTAYSGLASSEGTNLMIYPLSHIGPSNSSLMRNMCCRAPAVSSHFGLAPVCSNAECIWTTEIFQWEKQHSWKSRCCKNMLSLLALILTLAWVIYRRWRMFCLTFI